MDLTYNRDRRPRLEVLPTEYGGCYSGSRTVDDNGTRWHRITQFIMPLHSMIAASDPTAIHLRSWVPLTCYLTKARLDNQYNLDLELQKKELMFGVSFVGNIQDRAMTEAMGPIYKRWKEHLGSTDAMVIFVRRRLLDAARALREKGSAPANAKNPSLNRVRSASIMLPDAESWVAATEEARKSDSGAPIAWAPLPT